MRRLVLVGAAVAALALAGCGDGFKPVDLNGTDSAKQFSIYDSDGDSVDVAMAVRACESIGQNVDQIDDLDEEATAVVTCAPETP